MDQDAVRMGLIDSHAHLTFPELMGQVDDVLARSSQAGVDQIITVGTDLSDARDAIELAERYPSQIRATAGFHPHEAAKVSDTDMAGMGELWRESSVVACGEMGLDYHYDFADREVQRSVFTRQLEMALPLGKAIVIHCREAFDDVVPILVENGFRDCPVVFHCFTGSQSQADFVAKHGWRISFTGVVTFPKSAELQQIAKSYPVRELMVETDAPYLSPAPVRGKRPNEPAHVAHTARFLAELRGVEYEELVAQSASNTRSFFGLA